MAKRIVETLTIAIAAASLTLAANTPLAFAQSELTWTSRQYGCSLTWPGKVWTYADETEPDRDVLVLTKEGKEIRLRANNDPVNDAEFTQRVLDHRNSAEGRLEQYREFRWDGRPAHRFVSEVQKEGTRISQVTLALHQDDCTYILVAASVSTDADTDAEISECIDTFRVLSRVNAAAAPGAAADASNELTWKSARYGSSISWPAREWAGFEVSKPPIYFFVQKQDENKSVECALMYGPLNNESFWIGAKNGVSKFAETLGGRLVSSGEIALDGRRAHWYLIEGQIDGERFSLLRIIVVAAQDRGHMLTATSKLTDADKDPEILACLKTFHVLTPEAETAAPRNWGEDYSLGYRLGGYFGTILAIVQIMAFGIAACRYPRRRFLQRLGKDPQNIPWKAGASWIDAPKAPARWFWVQVATFLIVGTVGVLGAYMSRLPIGIQNALQWLIPAFGIYILGCALIWMLAGCSRIVVKLMRRAFFKQGSRRADGLDALLGNVMHVTFWWGGILPVYIVMLGIVIGLIVLPIYWVLVWGASLGASTANHEANPHPDRHKDEEPTGLVAAFGERVMAFWTMDRPLQLVAGFAVAQLLATGILLLVGHHIGPAYEIGRFAGEPAQVPLLVLVTVVIFLLVGWTLVLAAALNAPTVIRLAVLGAFTYLEWPSDRVTAILVGALWLREAVHWLRRWRGAQQTEQNRPQFYRSFLFAALLVISVFVAHFAWFWFGGNESTAERVQHVTDHMFRMAVLMAPFLLLAGADFAEIGAAVGKLLVVPAVIRRKLWPATALTFLVAMLIAISLLYSLAAHAGWHFLAILAIGAVALLLLWNFSNYLSLADCFPPSHLPFAAIVLVATLLVAGQAHSVRNAYSHIPNQDTSPVSFNTFQSGDEKVPVRIAFPQGWKVDASNSADVKFQAAADSAMVKLRVLMLAPGPIPQPNVETLNIQMFKELFFGDVITSADYGLPQRTENRAWMACTVTRNADDNPEREQKKSIIWYRLHEGDLWILEGESDERTFDNYYLPIFSEMRDSWQLDMSDEAVTPETMRFVPFRRALLHLVGFQGMAVLSAFMGMLLIAAFYHSKPGPDSSAIERNFVAGRFGRFLMIGPLGLMLRREGSSRFAAILVFALFVLVWCFVSAGFLPIYEPLSGLVALSKLPRESMTSLLVLAAVATLAAVGSLAVAMLPQRRGGETFRLLSNLAVGIILVGATYWIWRTIWERIGDDIASPGPLAGLQVVVALGTLAAVTWFAVKPPPLGRGFDLLSLLLALNIGLCFAAGAYCLYGWAVDSAKKSVVVEAGVLILALFWDLLMSGKQITNKNEPWYPRSVRVVLYSGYIVLLSTTILLFASMHNSKTHNHIETIFEAESIVQQGVIWLGVPYIVMSCLQGLVQWRAKYGDEYDRPDGHFGLRQISAYLFQPRDGRIGFYLGFGTVFVVSAAILIRRIFGV